MRMCTHELLTVPDKMKQVYSAILASLSPYGMNIFRMRQLEPEPPPPLAAKPPASQFLTFSSITS
jgi:hypothetical protein